MEPVIAMRTPRPYREQQVTMVLEYSSVTA
jgi:hypothetical protein